MKTPCVVEPEAQLTMHSAPSLGVAAADDSSPCSCSLVLIVSMGKVHDSAAVAAAEVSSSRNKWLCEARSHPDPVIIDGVVMYKGNKGVPKSI